MIELPPFRVTPGQAATYAFQWQGEDLAAATGVATYVETDGTAITTGTPVMDATGNVTLSLTAVETALFPQPERAWFQRVGTFQVEITGRETFTGGLFTAATI